MSDSFGGSGGSATAAAAADVVSAVQVKEARNGGAGVVRCNGNVREPRLLPFPPGTVFSFLYSFGYIYAIFFLLSLQLHVTSRNRNILKAMNWGC